MNNKNKYIYIYIYIYIFDFYYSMHLCKLSYDATNHVFECFNHLYK